MNSVSLPSHFFPIKEISPDQRQKIAKDATNKNKPTPLTGVPGPVAQRSAAGKIAASLKAGLIASVATFGNVLAGWVVYETTVPYYNRSINNPSFLLFSTTALSGISAASREYSRISKKEDSNDKTNAAPVEKAASTLEKVTEAVKAAWTGFGLSFSTLFAAAAFFNPLNNPLNKDLLPPMFAISTIVGLAQADKTYRSLTNGEQKSSTSKSLVLDEPKASVAKKNNASKIAQSQRAALSAFAAVIATFATGGMLLQLAGIPSSQWDDAFLFMPACMAVSGINAYSQKFLSLSKEEQFPDKLTVAPPVKHSTLDKMAKSLKAGWNSYAISLTLGLIGGLVLSPHPGTFEKILPAIVGASATYGIGQGVKTYNSLEGGGPTLKEQWKGMSKTKKRCVMVSSLAALTALGVFYIGPAKVERKMRETAKNVGNFTYNQYLKLAYSTKTKVESKPDVEWLAGYTFNEIAELNRLASSPDKAACADILYTCCLDKKDIGNHKQAFRKKNLLFHSDKFKNFNKLSVEDKEFLIKLIAKDREAHYELTADDQEDLKKLRAKDLEDLIDQKYQNLAARAMENLKEARKKLEAQILKNHADFAERDRIALHKPTQSQEFEITQRYQKLFQDAQVSLDKKQIQEKGAINQKYNDLAVEAKKYCKIAFIQNNYDNLAMQALEDLNKMTAEDLKVLTQQKYIDLSKKAQTVLNRAKENMKATGECVSSDTLLCNCFTTTTTLTNPNWLYQQMGMKPECRADFKTPTDAGSVPGVTMNDCNGIT